ncbi:hypothetical protein L8P13_19630 [Enterobacter cloacae]|uniref:hypothetical protein n=1 Tax=Enterobacter cloacae TaxID=550 RepID=UPI00200581E1|nr:hypothetical protein [Enterobacter cloacae]MCK7439846.1 hypothetical protein [Enterobacter cloacae]
MTPNNYASLRGTIARAKRHDCQKVVMRVTLVEELLLQLANAEKRIAELGAINNLFQRAKALMSQSGGTPIENSLNPIDAWLFEAERAANTDKGEQSCQM